ncbi:MAG: hypothetical protein L0Z52_12880 [Acidobacteria bacterium]|nr:hypothetical protein [Acidobacteriota bacterium]
MSRFQQTVSGICVGALLPLAFAAPSMAEPPAISPPRMPEVRQLHLTSTPLDLRLMVKDEPGGGLATTLPHAASGNISLQTSGGGWSGLSTAKKTWIIVGIVVGAAAIVAVVSNSGGDNNGGGGY